MGQSTRSEAFAALNGERQYQDDMSQDVDRPDMLQEMSMGDYIAAMEHNLAEARRVWYTDSKPYTKTVDFLRKCGGLTVAAMEQFGVVHRAGQ